MNPIVPEHPSSPVEGTQGGTESMEGTKSEAWPFKERRRSVRYLDFKVQMHMLVALIVLEVGLVVAGIFYLYARFSDIIKTSLYRIHHGSDTLFSMMLTEMGQMLVVFVGVNMLAVFLADRIWVHYVRSVLGSFRALVNRVADLDFTKDGKPRVQHRVLDQTLAWREKERVRASSVRDITRSLKPHADFSDPKVLEELGRQLTEVRQSLPSYSRRFVGRLKE